MSFIQSLLSVEWPRDYGTFQMFWINNGPVYTYILAEAKHFSRYASFVDRISMNCCMHPNPIGDSAEVMQRWVINDVESPLFKLFAAIQCCMVYQKGQNYQYRSAYEKYRCSGHF